MSCCNSTYGASLSGHLECLKILHSQGQRLSKFTTKFAAEKGFLEILKYAHENGCRWDSSTTSSAAEYGHLDCLRYAYEAGCPWAEFTTSSAAFNGNLDCLRYACEAGCPWDNFTTYYAAQNKELKYLFYCLENGCPIHSETLNELYKTQKDKNLVNNIMLRKVLLLPRLKEEIKEHSEFSKIIKEYEEFISKFYTLLESKSNLPIDVIKYEIMKYI